MSEEKKNGMKYFVSSPTLSSIFSELELNTGMEVKLFSDHNSCVAKREISNIPESAKLIRKLSDLEQYFLPLGSVEKDKNLHLVVESEVLTKLFEQFEVKHGCKIIK